MSTNLVFPTNAASNASICISINITDDAILEPVQTFSLKLNTSVPGINIHQEQLVFTITDDDSKCKPIVIPLLPFITSKQTLSL